MKFNGNFMKKFKIIYSKISQKDAKKLVSFWLSKKAKELIEILKINPFQNPPSYEKLVWNLNWAFSRRINIKHRLVYEVKKEELIVRILRMWSHYE